MSDLERLREWLKKCPQASCFANWNIDYTDQMPGIFGIFPAGLSEIGRKRDIVDNLTVTNRYNFAIYLVMQKAPEDDIQASFNAGWVMQFQNWVQEQSLLHRAPVFGNIDTDQEVIRAQNGALYEAEESGTAMYVIQLSAEFKKYYPTGGY